VPAKTLAEFIAFAKANPGKLNFGFGQGTLPQLVGVQMNIGTISTLAPLIREGKLRALAITSAERNAELPDVPTMAESGLPEVASVTYYGLFGPAGVPADAVAKLNTSVNESLKSEELRAAIRRIGFDPHGGSPEDFSKLLASEMKTWIPIVQKTGFQLN
jgi:tripartite-type tricarboxylate transporter receptor subunit TctC